MTIIFKFGSEHRVPLKSIGWSWVFSSWVPSVFRQISVGQSHVNFGLWFQTCRMWLKQCHKPPMTGNGKHTTYVWWFGGLFEWYKHGLPMFTHIIVSHITYIIRKSYGILPLLLFYPHYSNLKDAHGYGNQGTRATSWWGSSDWNLSSRFLMKAHDQSEISRIRFNGGTSLVTYFWPYELWGYSLKLRPEKWKIGLIYGIGTSNLGSWNGHWYEYDISWFTHDEWDEHPYECG